MNKLNTQFVGVIQIIYDEWQLSPKASPVSIPQNKLEAFPSADSILTKLQVDDNALTILERPNEAAQLPNDEFQSFITVMGNQAFEELMSYKLEINDSFLRLYRDATGQKDESIKYELKYSEGTQELSLFGVVIANPDFMSENEELLTFLFKDGNANRRIPVEEFLEYRRAEKLTKTFHQILDGLNIRGNLRMIFFPHVSRKGLEFVNPITANYAVEHQLPEITHASLFNNNQK
jgi:hypothetical protein